MPTERVKGTGTVYWLTGVSGVGKTTIGRLLYEHLSRQRPNVVFLDGDELREVFGNDLGHHREDRQRSAMRNARLCKMLSDQGIDVVCSTISLFHSCQSWNRNNISDYKEIFIQAPKDILVARDPKGLYRAALSGEQASMVGLDIKDESPLNPDVMIVNDGAKTPAEIVETLIASLFSSVAPSSCGQV
jgi:adenylylsulfate kinase